MLTYRNVSRRKGKELRMSVIPNDAWESRRPGMIYKTHHPSVSFFNLFSHTPTVKGPNHFSSSPVRGISYAAHCKCAENNCKTSTWNCNTNPISHYWPSRMTSLSISIIKSSNEFSKSSDGFLTKCWSIGNGSATIIASESRDRLPALPACCFW